MSKSNHTPGPWGIEDVRRDKTLVYYRINSPAHKRAHAFAGAYELKDQAEAEANAQLIAAAPELLEEAQAVMKMLEECGPSVVPHLMDTDNNAGERLRQAIKKARGES